MSPVRIRSFTVPRGSTFVCVPQDGSGPFIAQEGTQVTLVASDTWERAVSAMQALQQPEPVKDE